MIGLLRVRQFSRDWVTAHLTEGRSALVVALLAGVILRCYHLESVSMSVDEGYAWAAAAQPVSRLLQLQPQLDSGKLAVYDLLLHYWSRVFGESLRSLRGLSATIGVISIFLMFVLIKELYRAFAEGESGDLAAGFAALLFATNVTLVQSGRTARMYSLMTGAELAQIFFFVRAQRRGSVSDSVLAAIFLALAIAVNFTAAFLLISEVFWLAYLLAAKWKKMRGAALHLIGPALSLIGGLVLLVPWMPAATPLLRPSIRHQDFGWIEYRPLMHWSYEVLGGSAFNKAPFWLFLVLTGVGIWRHRSRGHLTPMFMAAATLGPFAAVAMAGLFGIPMMVDRYVLIAVIAFLGLAAIGAGSFQSKLAKTLIFLLLVRSSAHALRHSAIFWADWRQAAAMACAVPTANEEIAVVPGDAVHAVRYHLPAERRRLAVGLESQCGDSQILIIGPAHLVSPTRVSELKACYPHLLGRLTRVEVRSR
jgi:hypothetical protein